MKYRQAPNVILLTPHWLNMLNVVQSSPDGKLWHPARGCGLDTFVNRFYCAWLVFTGKADALIWPPFETALQPKESTK